MKNKWVISLAAIFVGFFPLPLFAIGLSIKPTTKLPASIQSTVRKTIEKSVYPACADFYHAAADAFKSGTNCPPPPDLPAGATSWGCGTSIGDVNIGNWELYECRYITPEMERTLYSSYSKCTLDHRFFGPFDDNNSSCIAPYTPPNYPNPWTGHVLPYWQGSSSRESLGSTFPDTSKGVLCVSDTISVSLEDNFQNNILYQQEHACDQAVNK